ncbi:MAG TPA: hypothetical protein VMP01_00010 [Pirellulaceae bacterium]|nr:hypothetical protein [Pirellulaceae bacterium]
MNRSFQSIAALLVSLSGAMLAVTWIPGEAPRPAAHAVTDRKRAAAVACGYLASGEHLAAVHPRLFAGEGDCDAPIRVPAAGWPSDSPDLSAIFDRARLPASAAAILPLPALRSVGSALGSGLAPLWPLRGGPVHESRSQGDEDERRRVEAEYAAAELAAAAPHEGPLMAPAWRYGVEALTSGLEAAAAGDLLLDMYEGISVKVVGTYEKMIADYGWQETIPPLVSHLRRQHDRLALREALLQEMDRRFLEMPLDRDYPLPVKPQYRGPSRKLILAVADTLKSLSQSLSAAGQRLEEVSRQDVAELHTPSENREEKR